MTATPQSDRQKAGANGIEGVAAAVLSAIAAMLVDAMRPHLNLLAKWIAWRFLGLVAATLATGWAAVGLTLAIDEVAPLWAAFLCVSGLLALGAAIAFTLTPKGRTLSSGYSKPEKKE